MKQYRPYLFSQFKLLLSLGYSKKAAYENAKVSRNILIRGW